MPSSYLVLLLTAVEGGTQQSKELHGCFVETNHLFLDIDPRHAYYYERI